MTSFTRVDASMFDEIHRRLLQVWNPNVSKDHWRRIFTYPWMRSESHVGYALLDRGDPVGFLGLIFSEMLIEGHLEKVCNVSSWVVLDTHRAEASALVLALRDLDRITVTNLTSNDAACRVFQRLGFEKLETHVRVLLPVPRWGGRSSPPTRVIVDRREITGRLSGADGQILRDHAAYTEHLLGCDADGYCYLVYSIGRRNRLRTARVHYASDIDRFLAMRPAIQEALWRSQRAPLIEMDERLWRGRSVPASYRHRLPTPRLFKSSHVAPEHLSNLYSEIALLNV